MKLAQENAVLALLFLCIIFSINGKSCAATRKIKAHRVSPTISVTGIVFCDKCFQGSLSNELTTPLQGAQVNLECSAEPAPLASAFTNKNGVFKLTVNSDYYTRHGGSKCLATLVKSPDQQCSIPTNIGNGSSGASMSERAGSAPNELIYSVGPFAFRPVRSSCKPTSGDEELPSEESSLHIPIVGPSTYTLIPPIPPAIIPSPHPGMPSTAPPISSLPFPGSPLLPFCPPPPSVIEQPTPETMPPPPAPEIVIPPTPPSPSPIPPPKLPPPPRPPVATPPPQTIKPPVAPVQHPPPVIKQPPPPPPGPAGHRPPPVQKSPPIPPYPTPKPPHPPTKSPPPHHAPAPSPKPSPKPSPPPQSPHHAPAPKPSPKPSPPPQSPHHAPAPKPSPKPSPKPQPPRSSPKPPAPPPYYMNPNFLEP